MANTNILMIMLYSFIILMSLLPKGMCYEKSYYAIIKSCAGWRLNHLPELKRFIREKVPEYPVEVVFPGGDPRLVIMDNEGNEVEEFAIADMTEAQLEQLFAEKGIKKFE